MKQQPKRNGAKKRNPTEHANKTKHKKNHPKEISSPPLKRESQVMRAYTISLILKIAFCSRSEKLGRSEGPLMNYECMIRMCIVLPEIGVTT